MNNVDAASFESGSKCSPPEVLLENCVLKICSKFTGEHSRRSVISTKLQSKLIEIILRHECSVKFAAYLQNTFL